MLRASVLTAVSDVPSADAFRPAFSGSKKTSYRAGNLNRSLLPKLALTTRPAASVVAESATHFEHPWVDHRSGWTGRAMHPIRNMPNYGREIGKIVSRGALLLMLDYTDAELEPLLINYVQLGIDLQGMSESGTARTPAKRTSRSSVRTAPARIRPMGAVGPAARTVATRLAPSTPVTTTATAAPRGLGSVKRSRRESWVPRRCGRTTRSSTTWTAGWALGQTHPSLAAVAPPTRSLATLGPRIARVTRSGPQVSPRLDEQAGGACVSCQRCLCQRRVCQRTTGYSAHFDGTVPAVPAAEGALRSFERSVAIIVMGTVRVRDHV